MSTRVSGDYTSDAVIITEVKGVGVGGWKRKEVLEVGGCKGVRV